MPSPLSIIIMAKLPEPGRVKTRLLPDLSAQQAADVYRHMLVHVAEQVSATQPDELVLCFDPPDSEPAIRAVLPDLDARFLPQSPGDLGHRMAAAANAIRRPNDPPNRRTLFLGVDSPDLPADHLRQAVRLGGHADVVLGPTSDGGYWCLGLAPHVDAAAMLANIDWSSGREADQTIASARQMGLAVALADPWEDGARLDDLHRLIARRDRSNAPRDLHLGRCLRTILEEINHG